MLSSPVSKSLPHSSNNVANPQWRPRPTRKARLWDRLLNAAERRHANSGPDDIWNEDITFAPRDVGDVHLRHSFEDAIINQGLTVTAEFTLSVEPPSRRGKASKAKRCHPIIHSINTPISPLPVPTAHTLSVLDDDENALEIPRRKPTRTPLMKGRRPHGLPPTGLPPSDLPLINRKARQVQSISPEDRQLSVRDRLRIDQESNKPKTPLISYQTQCASFPECLEVRDMSKPDFLTSMPLTSMKPGRRPRKSSGMKQLGRPELVSSRGRKRRKLAPSKNTNGGKLPVTPKRLPKQKDVTIIDVDALTDSDVDDQEAIVVAAEESCRPYHSSRTRRKPHIVSDSSGANESDTRALVLNGSGSFQNYGHRSLSCDAENDDVTLDPATPVPRRHRRRPVEKTTRTSTGNLPPRPTVSKKPVSLRPKPSLTSNLECHLVNGRRTNPQCENELMQKNFTSHQNPGSDSVGEWRNLTGCDERQRDPRFDTIQLPQLVPTTCEITTPAQTSASTSKYSSHSSFSGQVLKTMETKPKPKSLGLNSTKDFADEPRSNNSVYFILDDDFRSNKPTMPSAGDGVIVELSKNSGDSIAIPPDAQTFPVAPSRNDDATSTPEVAQVDPKLTSGHAERQACDGSFAPVLNALSHSPHQIPFSSTDMEKCLYSTPGSLTQGLLSSQNIHNEIGLQKSFNSEQTPLAKNNSSGPVIHSIPGPPVSDCSQLARETPRVKKIDDADSDSSPLSPVKEKSPEKDKSTVATETESTTDEIHSTTPNCQVPSVSGTFQEGLSAAEDNLTVGTLPSRGDGIDIVTVDDSGSKRHCKPTVSNATFPSHLNLDLYGRESETASDSSPDPNTTLANESANNRSDMFETCPNNAFEAESSEVASQLDGSIIGKKGGGYDNRLTGCDKTNMFDGNDTDRWRDSVTAGYVPSLNPLMTEAAFDLFPSQYNPHVSSCVGAIGQARGTCVADGVAADTNERAMLNGTRPCDTDLAKAWDQEDTRGELGKEVAGPGYSANPSDARAKPNTSHCRPPSLKTMPPNECVRSLPAGKAHAFLVPCAKSLARGAKTSRILRSTAECVDKDKPERKRDPVQGEDLPSTPKRPNAAHTTDIRLGEVVDEISYSKQMLNQHYDLNINSNSSANLEECQSTEKSSPNLHEQENMPLTFTRGESAVTTVAISANVRGKRYPTLTPATPLHASVYKRRMVQAEIEPSTYPLFRPEIRDFGPNNRKSSWSFSLMKRSAPPMSFRSNLISPGGVFQHDNSSSTVYPPVTGSSALHTGRGTPSLRNCVASNVNSKEEWVSDSDVDTPGVSGKSPNLEAPSTNASLVVYAKQTFAAICNSVRHTCRKNLVDEGRQNVRLRDKANTMDIKDSFEEEDTGKCLRKYGILRPVDTRCEEPGEQKAYTFSGIVTVCKTPSVVCEDPSEFEVSDKQTQAVCKKRCKEDKGFKKTKDLVSHRDDDLEHSSDSAEFLQTHPSSQNKHTIKDVNPSLKQCGQGGISMTSEPVQKKRRVLGICGTQSDNESSQTGSETSEDDPINLTNRDNGPYRNHRLEEVDGLQRSLHGGKLNGISSCEPVKKKSSILENCRTQFETETPHSKNETLGNQSQHPTSIGKIHQLDALQVTTSLPASRKGQDHS